MWSQRSSSSFRSKSIARSRCVSKDWCATISHDYSLRRRLPLHMSAVYFRDDDEHNNPAASGNNNNGPLFSCAAADDGHRRLEDRDLGSFFPFWRGAVVCDACGGLLLCRTRGTPRFYVVSPVTRRWAALPPPPANDAKLSILAFDPFSSSSEQYHYYVVNFTGWRERGAAVEVFSSETRAWAVRSAEFGGVPARVLSGSMHFGGGALHIPASDPDCVVRMDVVAGELACTVVDLPEPMDSRSRVAHSGGRLHYVTSDRDVLRIWALEQDDGSSSSHTAVGQWQLKHAVKVDGIVKGGGCTRGGGEESCRLLAIHPEKEAVYVSSSSGKIVEYDLCKKEIVGAWELVEDGAVAANAKNRVVRTWLVP